MGPWSTYARTFPAPLDEAIAFSEDYVALIVEHDAASLDGVQRGSGSSSGRSKISYWSADSGKKSSPPNMEAFIGFDDPLPALGTR